MNNFLKCCILLLFLAITQPGVGIAQYFQFTNKYEEAFGVTLNDLAVDKNGNSFIAGQTKTSSTVASFFVTKTNSIGKKLWTVKKFTSNFGIAEAQSVATDYVGNCYVSGIIKPSGGTISFDSIHQAGVGVFLLKISSFGNIIWVKSINSLSTNFHKITADSTGNIYVTNGYFTSKYNTNGNMVWKNQTYGGADIGIDADKKVYLLNSTSLIKLTNKGVFSWIRAYGGEKFAIDANGNSYTTCNDSIYKFNTLGNLVWSNNGLHGNDIAVSDSGKIYLALGNNLRKIENNGLTIIWSRSTFNAYCKFIDTNSKHSFIAGEFDPFMETIICPAHFSRLGLLDPYAGNKGFVTKINEVSNIPFQANIFTPPIPGDRLCAGVYFEVPYQVTLNTVSTFGPGNQFRAQLIDGATGDTIDIGKADSAFIPLNSMSSVNSKVRVVSTNPIVFGDENSPQVLNNNLILEPLKASIFPSGIVNLCPGNSISLLAANGPFNAQFYWYKNNNYLSNGPTDTVKTITDSGSYYFKVFTSDFVCQLNSATTMVNLVPNPNPSVVSIGPLNFCQGDSVTFVSTSVLGNTFQWKRNNANINGATSFQYIAKSSGNYKLKVTNNYGCIAFSSVFSVQVNCKNSTEQISTPYNIVNPFHESIISANSINSITYTRLFDSRGKLVLQKYFFPGEYIALNTTLLNPGLYILELQNNENLDRLKITKQ